MHFPSILPRVAAPLALATVVEGGEDLGAMLVPQQSRVVDAAAPASDKASNSPYVPGNTWVNAQNGGSGFGGWVLTSGTSSGFFIGSSSGNGGSPPSGNIDTAGVSWGMLASNGDTA